VARNERRKPVEIGFGHEVVEDVDDHGRLSSMRVPNIYIVSGRLVTSGFLLHLAAQ
jgi:hypothetical protein